MRQKMRATVRQTIKEKTQVWTGYIAIFAIYVLLFSASFIVTERIVDGTQVNADAQTKQSVQYCSEG